MSKILIRADGNTEIGLGHVIRCLALAEMLKSIFNEIYFVTRYADEKLKQKIFRNCKDIIIIPPFKDHFDAFYQIVSSDDIVVLDNYFFSSEYQQKLKSKGCKLVCISDYPDRFFFADVVINPLPGSEKFLYNHQSYTKVLAGLDYALLRKPFLEKSLLRKENADLNHIFICFGGSDPYQLTSKVILQLDALNVQSTVAVVLGEYNYKKNEILQLSKHLKLKIEAHQNLSAEEICILMLKSSWGIVPSSGILMEALALNLPCITGYMVENQKKNYQKIIEESLAIGIGNFLNLSITIDDFDHEKINFLKLKKFIDGNSPKRIIEAFSNLK